MIAPGCVLSWIAWRVTPRVQCTHELFPYIRRRNGVLRASSFNARDQFAGKRRQTVRENTKTFLNSLFRSIVLPRKWFWTITFPIVPKKNSSRKYVKNNSVVLGVFRVHFRVHEQHRILCTGILLSKTAQRLRSIDQHRSPPAAHTVCTLELC